MAVRRVPVPLTLILTLAVLAAASATAVVRVSDTDAVAAAGATPSAAGDPAATGAGPSATTGDTGASPASFLVGSGIAVTSPETPVCVGGYGAFCNRPSQGLRDELHARALAVSSAASGDTFVLVTATAVGLFAKYKPELGDHGIYDVRQRISQATGIPADHVIVTSDHSHAAPDTIGIWGGVDEQYMARLADGLVTAAVDAVAERTPADLRVAAFDARTVDAAYALDSSYDRGPTDDAAMDNEFRVLFADTPDGARLATFVNYAPHATVCGGCDDLMTGDWPEWAAQEAEAAFGGAGIATVGALGATDFRKHGSTPDARAEDGRARLRALLAHADAVAEPVIGDEVGVETHFIREQMAQPVLLLNHLPGIPSPRTLDDRFPVDEGEVRIDRATTPPWLTGGVVGTYASAVRIGDVFLSTFPGEPFPQLQDAVRESVGGAKTHFLIGAANDFLGYMVADEDTYQQTLEEGALFLPGCPEEELYKGAGVDHDGACPDHWTLMVSPTIGTHVVCSVQAGAETLGFAVADVSPRCAALTAADGVGAPAEAPGGAPTAPGTVQAGVASVDASWHLGASGGQFAEHQAPPGARGFPGEELLSGGLPSDEPEIEYVDPFLHAKRKRPARGLQSRIHTRALVLEGVNDQRVAIVGNDLYLPNDLLNRRVAQLLEQHDLAVQTGLADGPVTGITEDNLAITASHNHNSAFYSTPSWGTWVFQDVFDLRFFEYMASRMADAVIAAATDLRPVRIGAATVPFNEIQAHTIGPKIADDGTPAGQPFAHTTGMLTVVRVDDLTDPANPEPYANWVTLGLHPEWTWGYELFSGDVTHAAMRVIDRELGTTTVMSQRETGSSGPHKHLRVHEPEARREFQESGWQQLDVGARYWADAVHRAYAAIEAGEAPAPYDPHEARRDGPPIEVVPFASDLTIDVASARFAPPWTRPIPGVSNCNTASLFHGDWQVPVLGLPDCENSLSAIGRPIVEGTPFEEREIYDQLKQAGVPVPESYFGPKLTAVEETAAVHLMAMRIGDIAATFCPCEQFTDTALNIQTRLDRMPDNVWAGWDWTTQTRPDGRDFCVQNEDTTWTCTDPRDFREANWRDLPPITDLEYRRMRAQINNDADGWEDLANAGTHFGGEAEPVDPDEIKGNYTHREISDYGAEDGYGLTIAVGMANDYFGYTPSYREMRAYDHYRKALNGLGLHGSDYLATRLVRLAASLKGGAPVELSPLDLAYQAESARARVVSQSLGELARAHVATYDATLPADGGTPAILEVPQDIQRFDGAVVRFVGGSTYTDMPDVRVERLVDGAWVPYADQTGEVVIEARFPTPQNLPVFAAGQFVWEWTAAWETYVGEVPLPDATGTPRLATPAGTYRFVIDGVRRASVGDVVEAYHLESAPFEVRPWDGITVSAGAYEDRTIRFQVGPRTTEDFDGRIWEFGPIDYPTGWAWHEAITSVADKRGLTEAGAHGEHGERVYYRYRPGTHDDQPYCLFCRFRPWAESGAPAAATVTIENKHGKVVRRLPAIAIADEVIATYKLKKGERAYVEAGDLVDAHGNLNGQRSPVVEG
jgi:hypothetical protein